MAVEILSRVRIFVSASFRRGSATTAKSAVSAALDSIAVSTYVAAREPDCSVLTLATNLDTPPLIPKSAIRPMEVVASTTDHTPTAATPIVSSK